MGIARQTPLSMGWPRKEYWNGLSCPPPGDLPDPGIEPITPVAPTLEADSFNIKLFQKSKNLDT